MEFDLFDVDPKALSDDELGRRLVSFEEFRARFDALELSAVAEFDARAAFGTDGAVTAGSWLRNSTGVGGAAAREKVRVASRLRTMPATAEAFAEGAVSYAKVRLLVGVRSERTEEAFVRDESWLVSAAQRFGFDDFAKVLAHWRAAADPDGVSKDTAAQWERRRVALVMTLDGMWHLAGMLDPESGAIVKEELDAISEELFAADRREAANDPNFVMRTHAQRSADALVEMARRSAACDITTAKRNRPGVVVFLDHDVLLKNVGGHAELADGTIIAGADARRMACDGAIVRAVTLGGSEILDLGRSTPVPSAAQRRALLFRDGGCAWPGCDRPGNWCDAHHCDPYRRGSDTGGRTDLDDLIFLCSSHHDKIHRDGFDVTRDPTSGVVVFRRPDGTTITSRPKASPLTRRQPADPEADRTRYRRHRQRIDDEHHLARQRAYALKAPPLIPA